jgi:glycine/D-amino acid oxidase-like deaminating enzyme
MYHINDLSNCSSMRSAIFVNSMTKEKVLIVGAGIAGANAYYTLKNAGYDVTIIADPKLPMSSTVAAGTWNPVAFRRMIPSWKADEFVDAMKVQYGQVEKESQEKFQADFPTKKILSGEQEIELWKENSKSVSERYLNSDLETDNYNRVLGEVLEAGRMDIPKYLQNIFSGAVNFYKEAFNHIELKPDGDNWNYQNNAYSKVLFCEGNAIQNNPFFSWVPMRPVKGQVLHIKAPKWKLDYVLKKNIFVLPLGKDEYYVGATYEWDDLTWESTEKGRAMIEEKLQKVMPLEYEVIGQRAGVRPASPDRRPILGEHPEHKGLWIFNGLGSKGVFLAPLCTFWIRDSWLGNYSIPEETDLKRWIKKHYTN